MGRKRVPIKAQDVTPSRDKAWLLGLVSGDGNVRQNIVGVWAGLDLWIAKEAVRLFSRIYGVKAKIDVYGPGHKRPDKYKKLNYNVVCGYSNVVDDLKKTGPFGVLRWRVPRVVVDGSNEIKASWLSGIFDADGTCGFRRTKKSTHRAISVSSINYHGLTGVKMLMKTIGIKASKVYKHRYRKKGQGRWRTRYTINVLGRENIESFARLVGFRCPRKRRILDLCVRTFKHGHAIRRGEGLRLLPEILELRKQGHTLEQASDTLGLRGAHHAQEIVQRAVDKGVVATHDRGQRMRALLPYVISRRSQGDQWLSIGRGLGHTGTDHQATIFARCVRRWAMRNGLWPDGLDRR